MKLKEKCLRTGIGQDRDRTGPENQFHPSLTGAKTRNRAGTGTRPEIGLKPGGGTRPGLNKTKDDPAGEANRLPIPSPTKSLQEWSGLTSITGFIPGYL